MCLRGMVGVSSILLITLKLQCVLLVLVWFKCVLFSLLGFQCSSWKLGRTLARGFSISLGMDIVVLLFQSASHERKGGCVSVVHPWGPVKVPVFHVTAVDHSPSLLSIWRFSNSFQVPEFYPEIYGVRVLDIYSVGPISAMAPPDPKIDQRLTSFIRPSSLLFILSSPHQDLTSWSLYPPPLVPGSSSWVFFLADCHESTRQCVTLEGFVQVQPDSHRRCVRHVPGMAEFRLTVPKACLPLTAALPPYSRRSTLIARSRNTILSSTTDPM